MKLVAFVAAALAAMASAAEPTRVYVVGDSLVDKHALTVPGRGSWAEALRTRLKPGYEIINLGAGGTSTRTYRRLPGSVKRWEVFMSNARRGDWLIVGLGRNDASASKDRNTTVEEYKQNLAEFMEAALAKGVHPLLVTPVVDGNFSAADGQYVLPTRCLRYSAGMRELAKERGFAIVDIETPLIALLQSLGRERSRPLYMVSVDGRDTTHMSMMGAECVARIFCREAAAAGVPFVGEAPAAEPEPFPMPAIPEVVIPDRVFSVTNYGARADGTKCTQAFAAAIAACAAAGGGRVVVPAGRFFTGPIHLKSNVELRLEKKAVVEFSDDPKDCLPAVPSSWEGLECLNYSPLLYAYGCTNVALSGEGTIRAKMDFWKTLMEEGSTDIQGARAILYKWGSEDYPVEKRDMTKAHAAIMRPHLVQFNRCKGVRIEGVRVEDSPFWTIHLYQSEDVVVRRINVCAHGFNNDGIDIEMTQNVLIEGSFFDQGDDGFVFKAGRNRDAWRVGRPTKNVEIRNCRITKAGSLVGIGSELSGGIENVYVHDCWVGLVARLYYIKTNRRRGGFVRNVRVENVTVEKTLKLMALETDVLYQWRVFPDYELRTTEIGGLLMRHVVCGGVKIGVDLCGDANLPARDVLLDDVRVGTFEFGPVRVENVEDFRMNGVSMGRRGSIVTTPGWDNASASWEADRKRRLGAK